MYNDLNVFADLQWSKEAKGAEEKKEKTLLICVLLFYLLTPRGAT